MKRKLNYTETHETRIDNVWGIIGALTFTFIALPVECGEKELIYVSYTNVPLIHSTYKKKLAFYTLAADSFVCNELERTNFGSFEAN